MLFALDENYESPNDFALMSESYSVTRVTELWVSSVAVV